MITFTQGNLLEARADALVNTVNTVGVMGKGIALMFKERFAENFRQYAAACKDHQVQTGKMFITDVHEISGPRWIVNFPTKQHWRQPSKMEWIVEGLEDLRRFIIERQVKSIAIPPLGAGNGGLEWVEVRQQIEQALQGVDVDIMVFEPTPHYQNPLKRSGVEELTPARALIAELVRRYWIIGMECSLLEIQKLAWFLERSLSKEDVLKLNFVPYYYGPYSNRLSHLLNKMDGSYLHCKRRISDAHRLEVIWFDEDHLSRLQDYLKDLDRPLIEALEHTANVIDGFESPFGMELLATVDWLLSKEGSAPTIEGVRQGLKNWPKSAERKMRLFDDYIGIALERLTQQAAVLE